MAHEATRAHECTCQRSWADIDFEKAELEPDGRLAISHRCEQHDDETCVHIVSAKTAQLVKAAVCKD